MTDKCDLQGCEKVAACYAEYGDGRKEKLCGSHQEEQVRLSTIETYKAEEIERVSLTERFLSPGIPIVIEVSHEKNLAGHYTACIANPINSCGVGFGASPARALKNLGVKLSEDADIVLQRIREHESERRFLEREFATVPPHPALLKPSEKEKK